MLGVNDSQAEGIHHDRLWSVGAAILMAWLVIDLLCFALHIGHQRNPDWGTKYYSIEFDRGYGEFVQYIKEIWIALLLARLALRLKNGTFLAWSLVFCYLLLDDSLHIHERGGRLLAHQLSLSNHLGLQGKDLGELLVTASVGSVLFSFILVCYWRGQPLMRKLTRQLFMLVVCLAMFGVVVDMVHIMFKNWPGWYRLAGLVEDGGEMLVMSVCVWYAFVLTGRDGVPVRSLLRGLGCALSRGVRLA